MRRSFVFTALAVSAFVAAPALAQTSAEPVTPGTAPSVEAPAANTPAEQPAQSTHRQHRKHMQSSNAEDPTQSPRHRRSSKDSAEQEQTRQLNQQQLSAGATPTAPGTAMPGQMAPAEPMQPGGMMEQAPSTDQTVPADPAAPAGE